MIYNKYGLCAIKAYEKMRWPLCLAGLCSGDFWKYSKCEKGCPKNAFLGIYGLAKRHSKNADYALNAIEIIKEIPLENLQNITPSKFWRDYMGMTIRYNSQIDVVFALLDKGYLKISCNND